MKKIILSVISVFLSWSQVSAVDFIYRGTSPSDKSSFETGFMRLWESNHKKTDCLDSLSRWLTEAGYLDNAVGFENEHLFVTAGERFRLDKLVVDDGKKGEIKDDKFFTRSNLEQAIKDVLRKYYTLGYYHARADITTVTRNGNRVTVELTINRGPLVRVSRNILLGLRHVNPGIVGKYLAFIEGDTLTDGLIEKAEKAAGEIPFVAFQPPLVVRPEPGFERATLEYTFIEPRQFRFTGGGGYIPDDPTGIVWNINLSLRNLFGHGREININSERREKGRNILDLVYRQPLFLLGVDQVGFDVKTRDYRDQFYEFSLEAAYQTRLRPGFQAGFLLGWKRVEPSTNEIGYSRILTGFSVSRQALDNLFNPAGGYTINWTISYAYRRYGEESLDNSAEKAYNETRTELSLNYYRSFVKPLVGHVGLNYNGLESGETLPPVAELYFIGGPGTIRSFRNEQFTAQRTAYGTLEPRLRFHQGYLFLFYDAAYINYKKAGENNEVITEEIYRWGHGLGLALSDRERSVILSLGWNRELKLNQPRLSIELSAEI